MAGNVGTPLASLVGALDPDAVVVCEVSSFQLEDASEFAPDTALLLNLEEDHLDRHGTFEAYRDAKLRIFARQGEDDVAVAPPEIAVAGQGAARDLRSAGLGPRAGGRAPRCGAASRCSRPARSGCAAPTTWRTRWAAAAAALASGVPAAAVTEALRTFAGVPHRLEEVGDRGRRALRERLEGHERGGGAARHRGLRGRRARDPRRQPQGRRVRGPPRGGERALPRLLPDRRGRRAARAGPGRQRAAGALRAICRRRWPPPRRRPARARWCCCPRPARATTNTATTRSAASISVGW